MSGTVRTRFAPSPTGFMHVGNLRSALYEYLIARVSGGQFVLRIEDTDQKRLVPGALEAIYETLEHCGLEHDEGPDIGGPYGPYVQSERLDRYRAEAEKLIASGHAYRCFCDSERLEELRRQQEGQSFQGYDRHCRDLDPDEAAARAAAGEPFVIRQRMPLEGQTEFVDAVYGTITVDNSELEDQILLKSDGFPTYNFANVVDDHDMQITHVVRGSEYLSSTPKYNLLYDAFGYEIPTYVHLPLILGEDGQKLSKRHGATGFTELVEAGYLPEAILNYLLLLGWSPGDTREIFSLAEMEQAFTISGLSRSPATFDYDKLLWFNQTWLRSEEPKQFARRCRGALEDALGRAATDTELELAGRMLQPRLERLTDIPAQLEWLRELPEDYDLGLFTHKKMKTDAASSRLMLERLRAGLAALESWTEAEIHTYLLAAAKEQAVKNGQVMWPLRIAISGRSVTPGGAVELATLLGREETLRRIDLSLARLAG
ncbi:MAG: glutamate--tRNA ligase [Bacillota bacterium]|nr:glutamate--tRNA ligase [Bacillota bacterium]